MNCYPRPLAIPSSPCHPLVGGDPVYNIPYMFDKTYCVYILSSRKNGTLYIGMTDNLIRRVWEHKNKKVDGFTKKYGVYHLVYFEQHNNPESAIQREKQIKKWNRLWKIRLIEEKNPEWKDLYQDIL